MRGGVVVEDKECQLWQLEPAQDTLLSVIAVPCAGKKKKNLPKLRLFMQSSKLLFTLRCAIGGWFWVGFFSCTFLGGKCHTRASLHSLECPKTWVMRVLCIFIYFIFFWVLLLKLMWPNSASKAAPVWRLNTQIWTGTILKAWDFDCRVFQSFELQNPHLWMGD